MICVGGGGGDGGRDGDGGEDGGGDGGGEEEAMMEWILVVYGWRGQVHNCGQRNLFFEYSRNRGIMNQT